MRQFRPNFLYIFKISLFKCDCLYLVFIYFLVSLLLLRNATILIPLRYYYILFVTFLPLATNFNCKTKLGFSTVVNITNQMLLNYNSFTLLLSLVTC